MKFSKELQVSSFYARQETPDVTNFGKNSKTSWAYRKCYVKSESGVKNTNKFVKA